MNILQSSPVVVGGASSSPTEDVHRNTSKPPRGTNIVATLLIAEDRDGSLDDNRNSDASHAFKLTGQGAGFPGGFACRIEFGTEYKNEDGETVAPLVHLASDGNVGATIANVTPSGYDLSAQALGVGITGRVRVSVFPPT